MKDELTATTIGSAFKVHNTLGFGFLESVYRNALSIELNAARISHELHGPIRVFYEGHIVGEFFADVLIEDHLIVELKSVTKLIAAHEVQLVNYLTATKTEVGLLINFGPSQVDVRRKYRTYPSDQLTPPVERNRQDEKD